MAVVSTSFAGPGERARFSHSTPFAVRREEVTIIMRFVKLDGRLVLYPGTGFCGLENIVTICEPNGADEREY